MRRWIVPSGLAVVLAAGVAFAATSAEAAEHSSARAVKGLVAASESSSPGAFQAWMDLQALYDEISQVDVPYVTQADLDQFHDVLYTPDWVFVDVDRKTHTWAQEQALEARSGPPDSLVQLIERLTLTPDGATAVISATSVRTIVDAVGEYGRPGGSHTLTDTSVYRDRWVKVGDEWKLKSREQLSPTRVALDKPEWTLDEPLSAK